MEILDNKLELDSVLIIVIKCIKLVGMIYFNMMKRVRN